jgi:hypothetical protein
MMNAERVSISAAATVATYPTDRSKNGFGRCRLFFCTVAASSAALVFSRALSPLRGSWPAVLNTVTVRRRREQLGKIPRHA